MLAAKARTSADIADVKKLLQTLETIEVDKLANIAKWAACNRMFHARLFASSRCNHVCAVTNTLRDKVERYVRIEVSMTGHLDRAQAEHRQIFKAFVDGDAAKLGKLSREHCKSTADRLLRALKARERTSKDKAENK